MFAEIFYSLNRLIRFIINITAKNRKVIAETIPPHMVEYEVSPFILLIAGAEVRSNFVKKFSIILNYDIYDFWFS
jgi:hypothetical protein